MFISDQRVHFWYFVSHHFGPKQSDFGLFLALSKSRLGQEDTLWALFKHLAQFWTRGNPSGKQIKSE